MMGTLVVKGLRCSFIIQVKCNWFHKVTIVLTVKRNNCKIPLPETVSRFIFRKKVFIEYNYKAIEETPNNEHLLQSNLPSRHIEVRLIIVRSLTKLHNTKNNFPKENKPWELVYKFTDFYIKSHHF